MTAGAGRQPEGAAMSTALGIETETATVTDWTELASRENEGLAIGLYWSKTSGRLKVDVIDDHLDQTFEFDVDPGNALSAFYHPFAYAPDDSLCFGDTACDSPDLQPQN
jgi:hypothetical protein